MNEEPLLSRAQGPALSRLLGMDEQAGGEWNDADLAGIVRSQLDAPMSYDLPRSVRDVKKQTITEMSVGSAQPLVTFLDLISHDHPPFQLLHWAKVFFKEAAGQKLGLLPEAVAKWIYFAILASARLRQVKDVSRMSDAQLAEGIQWCMARTWGDPRIAGHWQATLAMLNGHEV